MKDFRRKAVILMLCFAMLALLLLNSPTDFVKRVKIKNATYSFFYDGKVSATGLRAADIGFGTILFVDLGDIESGVPDGFAGVSVCFDGGTEDVEFWIKHLRIRQVLKESIDGQITCFYGYSPLVSGGVYVDGNMINIQIAVNCGKVHIGSPLLLGSY